MRVVIAGTPCDAACKLLLGAELIVDARVAQSVLNQAIGIVDALGVVGVAHKLGVEVARVIRQFQGKSEVVSREDIFEKLGLPKCANPSCLARRVEAVRHRIGAGVEVVVVTGLVDANAPQYDGWMVPIAANHPGNVVDRQALPRLVPDMLPARHLLKNQQAKLIAGVQEVARLGIVGSSDDIAFEVPAQYLRIAPLHPPWHCRSDKWERLMTIEPTKLDNLAVEFESVFGENGLAKTNTSG